MGRRQIEQERLAIVGSQPHGATSLDEMSHLVDWAKIDRLLSGVSAAAKREPGWLPLALFRALLLATWHDLSDVRLAEALNDRTSSRRFCGFAAHEPTPERTAFVRFRRVLVRLDLDRVLFEAVTSQLDARSVVVRCGTLVDATPSDVMRPPSKAAGTFLRPTAGKRNGVTVSSDTAGMARLGCGCWMVSTPDL